MTKKNDEILDWVLKISNANGRNYSAIYAFEVIKGGSPWSGNYGNVPLGQPYYAVTHTCHANFQGFDWENVKRFVNNYRGDTDYAKAFFHFCISKESPWYPCHLGKIKPIEVGGNIVAYEIPNEVFVHATKTGLKAQLYNQLIAFRQPGEYPHHIESWYNLAKQGMQPADALLCGGIIQCIGAVCKKKPNMWNGGHQPLSIQTYGEAVSPTAFRKGQYDKTRGSIGMSSPGWKRRDAHGEMYQQLLGFLDTNPTRTKFSSLPGRATSDVIKFWNERIAKN